MNVCLQGGHMKSLNFTMTTLAPSFATGSGTRGWLT